MDKNIRYNGMIQCWFTEDGAIQEQKEDNAVLVTWSANGYKTDITIDEVSEKWETKWAIIKGVIALR
jgi:hypothetical protein